MIHFLILPNQLFDIKYLKQCQVTKSSHKIYIYEHPQYFTKYNFNKKKILLHKASMKYYNDYLKKHGYDVVYVNYNEKFNLKHFEMFNSADDIKMTNASIKRYENPNFLLSSYDHYEYQEKTDSYIFNNFYLWAKKKLNIIPNIKSTDKQNRKKLSNAISIPNVKMPSRIDKEYISSCIDDVNTSFHSNYGDCENFIYPISHKGAKQLLKYFIEYKFKLFGPYQDFIKKEESFLFHSLLSSSINIGLIQPSEIIQEFSNVKTNIPLNSYEGFIRQLFWREYQLYCYRTIDYAKQIKNPFFDHKKLITKSWYSGNTGNMLIDDTIKKAFKNAYLHHIERLMVMGNYMNLSEIKPKEGFKWFMEFSIDSYEWVMCQNVYDMVFFTNTTMRRPYISSSNYLLNMSDYKKGKWSEDWDKKYDSFVKKNKKKLWKYRYYFPSLTS